jgi:hypothetical protein
MIEFLKSAADGLKEEAEHYKEVKKTFEDSVNLFKMKPKTGENEVLPEYFFSIWFSFCFDFKEAWKRESQKLTKQRFVLYFGLMGIFLLIRMFSLRLKEFNETRNKIKNQPPMKKETEKRGLVSVFFLCGF